MYHVIQSTVNSGLPAARDVGGDRCGGGFDEQVKAAGAFVANGALQPAATDARLVRTKIDGHALPGAVEQRPFAPGTRQIQAFYLMECDNMDTAIEWANRLPTYCLVEVRELIDY